MENPRAPAVLAWLGLVSYSVYLVLPVLLDLYDDVPFPPSYHVLAWLQAGATVVFVAVLLGCAAMTYYLVECPMQRLGRRVARLDTRFGAPLGAEVSLSAARRAYRRSRLGSVRAA